MTDITEALAWSDQRIREAFMYDGGEAEYHDPINGAREQRRMAAAIFDRWIAQHDRALLASALEVTDEKVDRAAWAIRKDDPAADTYGVDDYRAMARAALAAVSSVATEGVER